MVDQIAVVTFTTPAAPGTLDVTSPLITEAFTAAVFIYSGITTDNADVDHAALGCGLCAPDGGAVTQEEAIGAGAEHGGAGTTPDTGTQHSITDCIIVANPTAPAGTPIVRAQYDSSIAGGVRLNFSVTTIQCKVTAILFAGLSRAYVSEDNSNTTSAHEPVGGTTDFEPDLLIFLGSDGTLNVAQNDAQLSLGFALNKAGLPQVSAYVNADDATEPTDADGYVNSARAIGDLNVSTRAREIMSVTSFDATGFNHIADAGIVNWHYLALKFSGAFRMAVANMVVSGSAGDQTFNDFGFTPDLVFGMSTLLGSVDTLIDGATASCSGYFVTGRYASRAYTWHHQEGLSGTGVWVAHSRQEDVAVLTYDHTGSVAQRATWVGGSGSGGFILNFSTATAGFLTALGIQLIPTPPIVRRPARHERKARWRLPSHRPIIGGKPIGNQPLTRLLQAVARYRRKALERLFPRRRFAPSHTMLIGDPTEEGSIGRISTSAAIRGRLAGSGVRMPDIDQ